MQFRGLLVVDGRLGLVLEGVRRRQWHSISHRRVPRYGRVRQLDASFTAYLLKLVFVECRRMGRVLQGLRPGRWHLHAHSFVQLRDGEQVWPQLDEA